MRRVTRWLEGIRNGSDGSLIWYALLLALVAAGVTVALIAFGPVVSQIYQDNYCLQCT